MEHPLRRWRESNGQTQVALAAKIGVTPSYLSMIETWQKTPSLRVAKRISAATDNSVTLDEFAEVGG